MSHRAALYTVRVHRKYRPEEERLLGDIDEQGTALRDVLAGMMGNFESLSEDQTKVVRCESHNARGQNELFLALQHGETGVAADILDPRGSLRLRQELVDTQAVKCGALFRLPPRDRIGWLAVHVSSGRGVKGLLAKGIDAAFRARFDDLALLIRPFVARAVLETAVDEERIDRIKLVKLERPNDRAFAATNKWVRAGEYARIELDIAGMRTRRLKSDLVRRFLRGNAGVLGQIIEFENMEFDEAKVEVVFESNHRRTFNIERPESGHPYTLELDLDIGRDGDPTEASLTAELRGALDEVA